MLIYNPRRRQAASYSFYQSFLTRVPWWHCIISRRGLTMFYCAAKYKTHCYDFRKPRLLSQTMFYHVGTYSLQSVRALVFPRTRIGFVFVQAIATIAEQINKPFGSLFFVFSNL